ncbi:hypothetical protein [Aquisalimonas sp.]|uniref:hypothetical protein n=1 Tax=Aquisalimonas sp. TaxID=1872621 RepID=UPI0025BF33B3|nr:hypothetical protein [Aquisalimonas sp.]
MSAIVHIGYHKTGTNWFQRHLYPNARSHVYVKRPIVREALLDVGAFRFNPDDAATVLGLEHTDNPILCEEELSGNLHTGGLDGCLSKDMAYRIHQVLPQATVVIFIRNQYSMVASAYKQYVREGGTYSAERYLNAPRYWHNSGFRQAKAPHFTFDHFDYLPLIRHYREVFGAKQVRVYPFEQFARAPEQFAQAFAGDLGLSVDWDAVKYVTANEQYRSVTFRLARMMNRLTYRDVAYKRHFLDIPGLYRKQGKLLRAFNRTALAGKNIPTEKLLQERHLEQIRSRYSGPNRELATLLALPLEELGYPT